MPRVEGLGHADRGAVRSHPHAAISDHTRRHAPEQLEGHVGVENGREVVVGVGVDEARGERVACDIDLERSVAADRSDRTDAVPVDGYLRLDRSFAAAIVEGGVAEDDVVLRRQGYSSCFEVHGPADGTRYR